MPFNEKNASAIYAAVNLSVFLYGVPEAVRYSTAMAYSLSEALRDHITGAVNDSPEVLEQYSRDASLYRIKPRAVTYPRSVEDVESLVRFATDEAKSGRYVSLTVRAAGTDMSGGPLNDSVIVDTTRHLNHLLALGTETAHVEPGMYFRDFDHETAKSKLLLPSYTASRELCTVGGMVANNSAGEQSLKFGQTNEYVDELEVVLADGKRHVFRELSGPELEEKCGQADFEGEVYRQMRQLLEEHEQLIADAEPDVSKNSSGYALWRVRDSARGTFNLAQLMVGAQGTLGIITKIRFRLVRPKPERAMTVIFLNDLRQLAAVVQLVMRHQPDSFESYDDHTFSLALKFFWEFAKQMKAGIIGLGFAFLPEFWAILTGGMPKLVLLVEFAADSDAAAEEKARTLAAAVRADFPVRVRVAPDERSAQKYWAVRRESFNLLRKKVKGLRTAPFIEDFVVAPKHLPEFLPKLNALLDQHDFIYTIAGHVGNGNFHIIPLVDPHDPRVPGMIRTLGKEVHDLVLSYGGSISGEHNDGLVRTPYVEDMFGEAMYALFEETKRIFDPHGIFNPKKKVGLDVESAQRYLDIKAPAVVSH